MKRILLSILTLALFLNIKAHNENKDQCQSKDFKYKATCLILIQESDLLKATGSRDTSKGGSKTLYISSEQDILAESTSELVTKCEQKLAEKKQVNISSENDDAATVSLKQSLQLKLVATFSEINVIGTRLYALTDYEEATESNTKFCSNQIPLTLLYSDPKTKE